MNHFLQAHLLIDGMVITAIANCAITSLPTPDEKSSKFYQWFFGFAHAIILAIPKLISVYKAANPAPVQAQVAEAPKTN